MRLRRVCILPLSCGFAGLADDWRRWVGDFPGRSRARGGASLPPVPLRRAPMLLGPTRSGLTPATACHHLTTAASLLTAPSHEDFRRRWAVKAAQNVEISKMFHERQRPRATVPRRACPRTDAPYQRHSPTANAPAQSYHRATPPAVPPLFGDCLDGLRDWPPSATPSVWNRFRRTALLRPNVVVDYLLD